MLLYLFFSKNDIIAFGLSVFYNTLINLLLFLISHQMVNYFLNCQYFRVHLDSERREVLSCVLSDSLKSTRNKMSTFDVYVIMSVMHNMESNSVLLSMAVLAVLLVARVEDLVLAEK